MTRHPRTLVSYILLLSLTFSYSLILSLSPLSYLLSLFPLSLSPCLETYKSGFGHVRKT